MLDIVKSAPRDTLAAGFDVEVLSVATANPPYQLSQAEAAARARELYPHLKKLWRLYDNTCIETRYNCEPIEWYLRPHSWEERTASFQKNALDLLEKLTRDTTAAAGVELSAIDMIVTNTVTGLAVPRRQADQPARTVAHRRTAADVRSRLRRRRCGPGARHAACAGERRRAC